MKQLLTHIWNLPQHLLALLLYIINYSKVRYIHTYKDAKVIWMHGTNWGISLGKYIFLSISYHNEVTVKHEYGHSLQANILGPLYLLIIGIPSGIRNRLTYYKVLKFKDYYKKYPENWADELGGVVRE